MPETNKQDYLNEAQRIALASYADGEVSFLLDCDNENDFHEQLNTYGDGLLKFIINELKDINDPSESPSMHLYSAHSSLETAAYQIQDVMEAIESARSKMSHAHRR